MSTLPLSELILLAEESASGGLNPWLVGGIALGILLALISCLVAFGAGREHS